jgi:hypothetical protein
VPWHRAWKRCRDVNELLAFEVPEVTASHTALPSPSRSAPSSPSAAPQETSASPSSAPSPSMTAVPSSSSTPSASSTS